LIFFIPHFTGEAFDRIGLALLSWGSVIVLLLDPSLLSENGEHER
jgi:hypothetical protein